MSQSESLPLVLMGEYPKYYTQCLKCGKVLYFGISLSWIEKMFFGGKLISCPSCKAVTHIAFQSSNPVPDLYAQLFKTIEGCLKQK
ncbi:MAG: hypothetical protein ACOCVY_02015 [Patescibacteria group bacterium]